MTLGGIVALVVAVKRIARSVTIGDLDSQKRVSRSLGNAKKQCEHDFIIITAKAEIFLSLG